MRIKVSDYIANFLCDKSINVIFTVVGGGAMHLNDSFGHHEKLHCVYNHHEQASAMAAEGYAKYTNMPAAVCVTSGPGAINTLNGIAGAYQDSVPMLVFTGQVKRALLEKECGLALRTLGGQEFDIVSAVGKMTKYAETVMDPMKIRYHLEKMYYLATTGRKGPCLLDIPVDVQGSYIETEELVGFKGEATKDYTFVDWNFLVDRIIKAERPVIYAGNGIRYSGSMDLFRVLIEKYQVPVVTCWDSIDLIETNHPLYCGRAGIMGDRAGNFAVQNSDFLLCIGNRLSIYQVGYNTNTWAREAFVVSVDIDKNELKKPTIRVDLPICMDATAFIRVLNEKGKGQNQSEKWRNQCRLWKEKYPVVTQKQKQQEMTNIYAFVDQLSRILPEGTCSVVTNGSASVVGSAAYYLSRNNRFIMNCAMSSMGYGLPAAIGVASAERNGRQVVCIEGDGSIMMNLQELATVVANNLPLKIFVINNNGYHQIRQTQTNIFGTTLVGIGPESQDLFFPSFEKIADAFGLIYRKIEKNCDSELVIQEVINLNKAVLCEVFVDTNQKFEPKSATKKLPDGTLYSPPLEDLAPFLSREELKENMFIPMMEE